MQRKDSYVIEIGDEAVGLALHDRHGVVFHAVHPSLVSLQGKLFPDATDAVRAAQHALRLAA